jgi:hypothetical protein
VGFRKQPLGDVRHLIRREGRRRTSGCHHGYLPGGTPRLGGSTMVRRLRSDDTPNITLDRTTRVA